MPRFRVTFLDHPGEVWVWNLHQARTAVGADLWETDEDRRAWFTEDFSAVVEWV